MQVKETRAKFVNAGEMALRCGVHRATIGRWARSGRIIAVKLPDGGYVIPAAEADRVIAERSLQRR